MCKLINMINAKFEEMYNYNTSDRIGCKSLFQLTQLTSPDHIDQIKYFEQQEKSLPQFFLIPREESLLHMVLGIYYHNAILQNLSKKNTCSVSIDLIDSERSAVNLDDQTIAKDTCCSSPSKKDFLKTIIYIIGKERLKSAARILSISCAGQ
jgi:hypothetical protein